MNPFIERKHELVDLNRRKDKIAEDIGKIKKDLESKLEALTEVHKNLLADTEKKIKEFPKICDHTNEDGSVATGKEHKILIPDFGGLGNVTLVKQMCSLCGGTVSESKIEIERKEPTQIHSEFKTWYEIDDNLDSFMENLTFDPNFISNFAGYIDLFSKNKK